MCACSCRVFWDLLGAVLRPSTQADRASAGRCAGRAGTAQASSAACITCGHNLVLVQLHSSLLQSHLGSFEDQPFLAGQKRCYH